MNISSVTDTIQRACIQAQQDDVDWCGYWRKPPEYLFTTYIASYLADLASDQERRYFVELECDISETIHEGYNGKVPPEFQRYKNKKNDIVISRNRSGEDSESWAVLEVKNGWYGSKGMVLEKDMNRLCDLMRIPNISLIHAVMVLYVFESGKSARKQSSSVSVRTKCENRIEYMGSFVRERKLRFGHVNSKIFVDDEMNAWRFVVARISR